MDMEIKEEDLREMFEVSKQELEIGLCEPERCFLLLKDKIVNVFLY